MTDKTKEEKEITTSDISRDNEAEDKDEDVEGQQDQQKEEEDQQEEQEEGQSEQAQDQDQQDQPEQDQQEDQDQEEENKDEPDVLLARSTRLKGYITFCFGSALAYYQALNSDNIINDGSYVVPSSRRQKRYALSVTLCTGCICAVVILLHFDRFTCLQNVWKRAFRPDSHVELFLLIFLAIWWIAATWVHTSVRGTAGDGKNQYNLYFATWVCCINSIWMIDRWLVAAGHSSFGSFMTSWPHRSPAWMAAGFFSFVDLLAILDLYLNWEEATLDEKLLRDTFSNITDSHWQWLLFVTAFTTVPASCFVVIELFRSDLFKGEVEFWLEGVILCCLVCAWLPTVVIATAPNGAASFVGNAYFLTWATAIFVMDVAVWWMHDWRMSIHGVVEEQWKEYEMQKKQVLEQNLKRAAIEQGGNYQQQQQQQQQRQEQESVASEEAQDETSYKSQQGDESVVPAHASVDEIQSDDESRSNERSILPADSKDEGSVCFKSVSLYSAKIEDESSIGQDSA
eukprot:CAMPEP_0118707170 /NCGR_PEP_ID=MMETSP0800-20121206/21025_1 /TAXON_ID=210618 ORGANISM="Striatella unipunctata, Strain CCMP2910" /NCGR_SAMPLE_ID=MMETSP0800 /ASSEMBLY_ACC=CAM_ASM_000638 /LENGTH=511 /DNA_ID=CAMNT_0006609907 /DNA_START=113 /DNA_END=1648 /DNA_ORIENTATION=+